MRVRRSAVAGQFYPADPQVLRSRVERYLAAVASRGPPPKAMVLPHAGHIYSGPVAASGYARLQGARGTVDRVVLLGPAHFVPVAGLAATSAEAFETPLGLVPVDTEAVARALGFPQVETLDGAHAPEHSLEVHLPFLQETLGEFRLVPLLVGQASPDEVGEVVDALWGGAETLVIVSSDLSHYHDYETARRLDARTAELVEGLRFEDLRPDRACGAVPLSGLLCVARRRGLRAKVVDLRSSGDTAGSRDRVVGYGAFVLE